MYGIWFPEITHFVSLKYFIRFLLHSLSVHGELEIKVKQSLYMREQTVIVPGGWCFRISRKLAPKYFKLVSPLHRPPLHPRKYSFLILFSVRRWVVPQGQSGAESIMSMNTSSDTTGNRNRDFPTCSGIPQQTAPPRSVRAAHSVVTCYFEELHAVKHHR
jgi:hypothetical protein